MRLRSERVINRNHTPTTEIVQAALQCGGRPVGCAGAGFYSARGVFACHYGGELLVPESSAEEAYPHDVDDQGDRQVF